MTKKRRIYQISIALLLCLMQTAGIAMYGQSRPRAAAKRIHRLQADSLAAVRQAARMQADSLNRTMKEVPPLQAVAPADSIATADSIAAENKKKLLEMTSAPVLKESEVPADSLKKEIDQKIWVPNPTKATWLALVIPGGGQIYNRKYWKLPIFYGGFAGCAYALTWNSKMYKDYSTAYKDAMNGNMQSSSITDLLPHLGAKQSAKTLAEGITAEDLNVIIASLPIEDKDAEQRVKLNVLGMLNETYGITERDFTRAEIEVVPAYKARDIGLDRAMIGAYGHDDRVDAYPALMAEIGTKNPAYTSVCVLTDKEETGSDGVTGLNSMYTFHFLQQLCAGQGADYITACKAAKCLSADVTAAYDPTFADAFEPDNGTYAGRGVAIYKYTGSRGKSGTSDASAELVSYLTGLMDANSVVWQIGEMGKLDLGGGGTVAKYVANQDIDTIDIGVPVLSMHSPFEIVSKADVYMAYLTFKAFCEDAE